MKNLKTIALVILTTTFFVCCKKSKDGIPANSLTATEKTSNSTFKFTANSCYAFDTTSGSKRVLSITALGSNDVGATAPILWNIYIGIDNFNGLGVYNINSDSANLVYEIGGEYFPNHPWPNFNGQPATSGTIHISSLTSTAVSGTFDIFNGYTVSGVFNVPVTH